MTALWWVRDDLRLYDNPALAAAAAEDGDVLAVHVDERIEGVRDLGGATLWWLHHSLARLGAALRAQGIPLVLVSGDPEELIPQLVRDSGADSVLWNRRYHAPRRAVDARLKSALREQGLRAESFDGYLLHEPWTIATQSGDPYKVYSAYARARGESGSPRSADGLPPSLSGPPDGVRAGGHEMRTWLRAEHFERMLDRRGWLPTSPDWAGGLREAWSPGEEGARQRLEDLDEVLGPYAEDRERPATAGTTRLSPHLRFGEVSPHEVWHRSVECGRGAGPESFRRELLWREFAWHRLFHLPDLATRNVRRQFDRFDWREDPEDLRAWQRGRTGIDLVDAGMRQLWETGWMHNRVRLVTGSFLTKNLRQHWRHGEEWFWDTLVDADEASNPFNWQWVAGSGDDAAPYFRVFNPVRQQERFDPDGSYVSRWVPEIGTERREAPIVDLRASRRDALAAYEEVKGASAS
ncbi:cryptochrome/photolyase family protein [Brachybacterium paraconglomeratum]|uniref:cryptochrome/photolyase family protein n=1 Tax=Brachybacterium paraconglomeratum TaxID=173362 RepID=UPI0022AFFC3E|nr:deoxyribodipyrimidine photo-lyase [Brachybacterium paraconglomeratum]MCZ4326599.1 deoxyribodipyrimidine photo-lyase [Brachybacterium paraconglomeratum]